MDNKTTAENQEIDLSYLWQSLKDFFENIVYGIFRFFTFFIKNIVATIVVLIIGVALAVYMYNNDSKAYKGVIVVATNFGSTEYTYGKINNFNRRDHQDLPLLSHVTSLDIKPVIDVYSFISDEEDNLDIAKYMSENTIEVSKYKEDNNVEKLYKYHKIEYTTDIADDDGEIYKSLMNYLNKDDYFAEIQKIGQLEAQKNLTELEKSVENINDIFNSLGVNRSDGKGDIKIDMYSQINDLMLTKNSLLKKINKTKVQIVEQQKVVYDINCNRNLNNKSLIKPILLVFVLLFLLYFLSKTIQKYKKFRRDESK